MYLETLQKDQALQETVPYTWQFKGKEPGVVTTLMFLLHGNEDKPLYVLNQLLQMADQSMAAGILNLIIGNPLAWQQGTRFVEEDGNRLWGNGPILSAEKARIEELKPIVASSDVMIDFHSTLKPSDPFLVIPELHHALASAIPTLGIAQIITGDGLKHPSGEPIESDLFAAFHKALGITFETGGKNDTNIEAVLESTINCLVHLGIFKKPFTQKPQLKVPHYKITKAYSQVFAEKNFKAFPWENFEAVKAGTVLGLEGNIPIIAAKDSRILFPKSPENVVPGNQVCLLVEADDEIVGPEYFNQLTQKQ